MLVTHINIHIYMLVKHIFGSRQLVYSHKNLNHIYACHPYPYTHTNINYFIRT
jgi:hypothetical protein